MHPAAWQCVPQVVVGAAAVLGAACRAPLTAMALMVEITRWAWAWVWASVGIAQSVAILPQCVMLITSSTDVNTGVGVCGCTRVGQKVRQAMRGGTCGQFWMRAPPPLSLLLAPTLPPTLLAPWTHGLVATCLLFSGVTRFLEHNIAHLDIKPAWTAGTRGCCCRCWQPLARRPWSPTTWRCARVMRVCVCACV